MKRRLLTAAAGVAVLTISAVTSHAAGAHRQAAVRFVPAASGHVLTKTLSFPPSTRYCRDNLGISCYNPRQYQKAYNLHPLYRQGIDGAGSTIVIVDAFGSPTITDDLAVFDQTYNLPAPPSFNIIQPAGAVPPYPQDPFGESDRSGWAVETTLDVEYAHAMAPGANLLLVETPQSETEGTQGLPQIVQAEKYVLDNDMGDVITQSFGATEETFRNAHAIRRLRTAVKEAYAKGVPMLASSGDLGATDYENDLSTPYPMPVNSWPSADPLTTSVGGTQLDLDRHGRRLSPDVTWNDGYGASGGGDSHVFHRPGYQLPVKNVVGHWRGTPDISMSAAVNGGAVFYYSFCDYSRSDPTTGQPPLCGPQWHIVGGTSEASPLFSGVIALADQFAGHRIGTLNPTLYSLGLNNAAANGIVDVTSGDNSFAGVTGYPALPGYDMATGLGTVNGAKFVRHLAAASPPATT